MSHFIEIQRFDDTLPHECSPVQCQNYVLAWRRSVSLLLTLSPLHLLSAGCSLCRTVLVLTRPAKAFV